MAVSGFQSVSSAEDEGSVCMAPAAEQQRQPLKSLQDRDTDAYASDQVSLKSTPVSPSYSDGKSHEGDQLELLTVENEQITSKNARQTLVNVSTDGEDAQLGSGGFLVSGRAVLTTGDSEETKDGGEKQVDEFVGELVPVDGYTLADLARDTVGGSGMSLEQVGAAEETRHGYEQLVGSDCGLDGDIKANVDGCDVIEDGLQVETLSSGKAQPISGLDVEVLEGARGREVAAMSLVPDVVTENDVVASGSSEKVAEALPDDLHEDVEIAGGDVLASGSASVHCSLLPDSLAAVESHQNSSSMTEEVDKVVSCLVDDVVACVNATGSADGDDDDNHDLLPEHNKAEGFVAEDGWTTHEYQWFDGNDEDDDEEEVAVKVPSVFDVITETTDDVFGSNGDVYPTIATQSIMESTSIDSDDSADTLAMSNESSYSSSRNSSSSSSSSGSLFSGSSSSESSSSESFSPPSPARSASSQDLATIGGGLKKRRTRGDSGPRNLMMYTKRKRVRALELEKPSQRHHKSKRKFPKPIIPPEFAVFEVEAADPILKGLYSVRNNRRACFHGKWGFGEEDFNNMESVSPFEYTSRASVPHSRHKGDKRPVSGRYGGFFNLRQLKGASVKVREDQLDLQFLPMSSEDEGEDEDEGSERHEYEETDGDERAASRYTVLGKGKNRFGRFLIRGYLHPESGRLTVKRRYLE
uniref:Uncharacterized protein n=1 Tax=Hyaloperonospora arabidopsidis (strain Emoy2) TaxID=559515 RepID=M4BS61_HYAAE